MWPKPSRSTVQAPSSAQMALLPRQSGRNHIYNNVQTLPWAANCREVLVTSYTIGLDIEFLTWQLVNCRALGQKNQMLNSDKFLLTIHPIEYQPYDGEGGRGFNERPPLPDPRQ